MDAAYSLACAKCKGNRLPPYDGDLETLCSAQKLVAPSASRIVTIIACQLERIQEKYLELYTVVDLY
ncbi:hypothetical protein M404DRAFT_993603 [Pisolithus tinctorius Marx 270]|uniref:Uncharacterized protein n=1 Tax=Pisolithus tinctorius Marx 270 TaxID=870435 RepID=A0A0C3JTY7_PISTI|nr:hypothetical protein M404DRAFT_993603 [Pisolithus tinctorius Marx 270]